MMNADLLVLGSAWLSGVMGSAHCAAMCGGIATGFGSTRAAASWLDALEPNVGRMLGYGFAGLLAGGAGHGLVALAQSPGLTLALRSAVGLVLVVAALRLLDRRGRLAFLALPARLGARWMAPLLRRLRPTDTGTRRVLAGIVWGWLPCGLSSTVLLAAWLQGSALQGAMTMLAFGLGTMPAMVPLTWSGARLGQGLQKSQLRIPAAAIVLVAGVATIAGPWLARVPAVHGILVALGCRSLG
jgi:sulfite exporter TauE/SafE